MKNNSPDDFESALRRDAALARQRATPSDDLAARITREVHRSRIPATAEQPARTFWRAPLLAFAGLTACAALAVMMLNSDSAAPANLPSQEQNRIARADPIDASAPLPLTETWAAIKPEAQALLAQDPLQTEVNAVVSDARSALHFLALNFLPSPTTLAEAQSG